MSVNLPVITLGFPSEKTETEKTEILQKHPELRWVLDTRNAFLHWDTQNAQNAKKNILIEESKLLVDVGWVPAGTEIEITVYDPFERVFVRIEFVMKNLAV